MPLIVNGTLDVLGIIQQTPNEKRIVKKLIVNGKEVWSEPKLMSQTVNVVTGSNGFVNTDGVTRYSGSKSVDIGTYRKKVSVSSLLIGSSTSVSYTHSTGNAVVSATGIKANQTIKCTLKYYT